jgi:hypothetical protein
LLYSGQHLLFVILINEVSSSATILIRFDKIERVKYMSIRVKW